MGSQPCSKTSQPDLKFLHTKMRPSFVILLIGTVAADYPYYTDYNNYNSVYDPATVSNISSRLHGIKRTWNPDGPFTFGLSTSLDIPLADLGVTLSASLPFSWTFDGATTRVFSGRSIDHRESMFSQIGKHLAQVAGGRSGHGCIQRTICEVAATPSHNDGLFGDIMNVVFSATSTIGEDLQDLLSPEYKDYLEAETLGREGGDCSSLASSCPLSLFSFK